MIRKFPLTAFAAAQCLIAGLVASVPANAADNAPAYFLNKWTVTSNCTEANAGPAARVQTGLQFKVVQGGDGSYRLQAINSSGRQWASPWNGLKLVYRPGTKMTAIPADFACAAGAEASSATASPLLAMSGYVQTAEPQYQQEHLYGLANIHGQFEHVLIFPLQDRSGDTSVVVVLESATSGSDIALDDNGVIHGY